MLLHAVSCCRGIIRGSASARSQVSSPGPREGVQVCVLGVPCTCCAIELLLSYFGCGMSVQRKVMCRSIMSLAVLRALGPGLYPPLLSSSFQAELGRPSHLIHGHFAGGKKPSAGHCTSRT